VEALIPLIRLAQKGEREAYGKIVARFQNMAYGYAYAILGDFDLAQDAAQEAFIEAYRCLPMLREELAFPAWLKRIIFKHCDRLTRGKRANSATLDQVSEWASPLPGPSEIIERSEIANHVQKAIQELSINQRVVTTLFYIDGYTQQEIADFLDIPAKTVKSRLYASRQQLKERILEMVKDEFTTNALPDQFTQETVEQAVARAAILNQENKYDQAESLLRSLLEQAPTHPTALKELNRTLMHGRVYSSKGRWDLLKEIAAQGTMILQSVDDEETRRQLAKTYLAIPAMSAAVQFLESWIADKGLTIERLGMLSWARGCLAEYPAALELWNKTFKLAQSLPANDTLAQLPFIAYSLVDCLSEAGDLQQAQRIARQVWDLCGLMGPLPPQGTFSHDSDWLLIWRQAQLDVEEILPALLGRHAPDGDARSQAIHLALRSHREDADIVIADWMGWVRKRIELGEWDLLEEFRFPILRGLRARGLWQEANQLAENIWLAVGNFQEPSAEKARIPWDWERFNPLGAIAKKDWQTAEALMKREIKERGVEGAIGWVSAVVAGSGIPTPPEIMQAIEIKGISAVDEYGMFGWYLVAREAAASGDTTKAFDALRQALTFWSNSPYCFTDLWESDRYWGDLRSHPEFEQAFDERRQRIGPIHGLLHYFPGW